MNCSYCSDTAKGYDDEDEPTCGAASCTPVTRPSGPESDDDADACAYCTDPSVRVDKDGNPTCGSKTCRVADEGEERKEHGNDDD